MAAPVAQNPVVKSESKSAKKKKAAKTASTDVESPASVAEVTPANVAADSANGDGTYESPYIKELYKYVQQPQSRYPLCEPMWTDVLIFVQEHPQRKQEDCRLDSLE